MHYIDTKTLEQLRKEYPIGTRVERIKMDDPYNTKLVPGCQGTVRYVDDMGTIHVAWDCGCSGRISCRIIHTFSICLSMW